MFRLGLAVAVVTVVVTCSSAMALPVWSNAVWVPYTSGGQIYWDPFNDINPEPVDLIGKDPVADAPGLATLYWFLDDVGTATTSDDVLMFRERVDETPAGNVYIVAIDTDLTNWVDWVVQVDQAADQQVEMQQAVPGGPTWGDVDVPSDGPPDNNPYEWTGTLTDWSRIVDVSTEYPGYVPINGTADFFVDFAIPWQDFANAVGFTNQSTPIRLAALTSEQDNNINKDLPGAKTDLVNFGDPIIPEPSTMALLGIGLLGVLARRRRKTA